MCKVLKIKILEDEYPIIILVSMLGPLAIFIAIVLFIDWIFRVSYKLIYRKDDKEENKQTLNEMVKNKVIDLTDSKLVYLQIGEEKITRCKYCEKHDGCNLEEFNYDDFYSCELMNEIDSYIPGDHYVDEEECAEYLGKTCKYREEILKRKEKKK